MSSAPSKRGRPRIPESWTKVISLSHMDLEKIKVHVIATDLLMQQGIPGVDKTNDPEPWIPAFCPRTFVKNNPDIKT